MRLTLVVGAVAVLLAGLPAQGAIVSLDTSAPSGPMVSQTTWGSGQDIQRAGLTSTTWREVAQTFTAPSTIGLTAISVMIEQDPDRVLTNLPIWLDVFSTSAVTVPSGTSLASEAATIAVIPAVDTQYWMTMTLADPIQLTQGGVYGFRLSFTTPASSTKRLGDRMLDIGPGGVGYADGNLYADGMAFRWVGNGTTLVMSTTGGWGTASDFDLAFALISEVPEPATLALLGLGTVGLLRRRAN